MQVCINFSCPKPTDPLNANNPICRHCESELILQNRYRVVQLLSDQSGFGNVYEVDDGGRPKILKVLKQHYNRYWILSGVLAILLTIIGSAQVYSQSEFSSDIFTLFNSLMLLENADFKASNLSENSSIKAIAFNSNSEILASTFQTNIIKTWNLSLKERLFTLTGQQEEFRFVTFSDGGNALASAK